MNLSIVTDEQIITDIRAGGAGRERAADYLLKQHLGFVRALAGKLFMPEEQVLDCYIDALADVVQQVGKKRFRGDSKISTYLYRITYCRCVDVLRRKNQRVKLEDEFPEMEDLSQQVARQIEIESEVKALKGHLDDLGSPCNQILMDWAFWGYSMIEIAQRNGLSSAKIAKSRKYQCLMQLRKLIQPSLR